MRARYYDPTIGRFIQEDPLGARASRNLYAYVDGSPLQAADPSGMQSATPPNYVFCSITSGACLSADGSMVGGNGGGGGIGGYAENDFDGDGTDDIKGFADEAWAAQQEYNAKLLAEAQGQEPNGGVGDKYASLDPYPILGINEVGQMWRE